MAEQVIAEQGRLLTLPPKPIQDMDFKPAKIFTQSMMKEFAVLTNRPMGRPGFINPDMRPSWWPTSIPWEDRVLQLGRKKDDFLLIIRACFSYFKVQSHLIGYPVTPPVTELAYFYLLYYICQGMIIIQSLLEST